MRLVAPVAFASVVALSACAGSIKTNMASESVDSRYLSGGGRLQWGDEIIALARVFEHRGKLAVCGVWTVRGETTMASATRHLFAQAGVIQMDGRNVVTGFAFMPYARYRKDMTGTETNCVVTDTDWQPHFDHDEARVVLSQQDYGAGEMEDTKQRFRRRPVPHPIPEDGTTAGSPGPAAVAG